MNQDNVIAVLIGLLNDKSNLDARVAAADALGYTGFAGGRTALLQIIEDKQEEDDLRYAAIRALGRTVFSSK